MNNIINYVRARSRSEALERDWRSFLLTVHLSLLDREYDSLFFASTKPRVNLRQLHVASINRFSGADYQPTPRKVFKWAMSAIKEDFGDFVFVDYGAGRGRVLMMAAGYPFKRVVGIEFAEELHNDAVMNMQQFPRSRMKCRDVECVLNDVVRFTPAEEPAVLYFFNPFGPVIFREVMDRIVQSYRANPRRLYVVLVDPQLADIVENTEIFRPLPLPPRKRLRVRLFSPYRIVVYRSVV